MVDESSVGSLSVVSVLIAVTAIMLTMGGLITDEIRGTSNVLALTTGWQANTTVSNASVMTLGHSRIVSSDFRVWNGTAAPLTSSNYTLTCGGTEPYRSLCTLHIVDYNRWNTTFFTVNYTYQLPSGIAYNTTVQGLTAIDTVAGFLPIIGVVLIAAAIIGIIASSMRGSTGI